MAKKNEKPEQGKKEMKPELTTNGKPLFIVGIVLIIAAIGIVAFGTQSMQFGDAALVVNGEEITIDQVREVYATSSIAGPRELVLNAVVNDLVNYELMVQDAAAQGIVASEEEIEQNFAAFLQTQGITEEQFAQALEQTDTTVQDYKDRIARDIVVNKILIEQISSDVSETEVTQFYQENIARFLVPGEVVVRQITLPADLTQEELELAVNTIFTELQTRDFCEVAEQYSLDTSCASYGISPGDAFPAYEQAAFSQENGDITLVQDESGYYFVQTLNKLDFNPIPLQQVGETIQQQLGQERFQQDYAAYIARLRSEATIVNTLQ